MTLQTCRYQRDSAENIDTIEALRSLGDYVTKLANETHSVIKSLEETNQKMKVRFQDVFNLQTQVAEIDPLVLRQRRVGCFLLNTRN